MSRSRRGRWASDSGTACCTVTGYCSTATGTEQDSSYRQITLKKTAVYLSLKIAAGVFEIFDIGGWDLLLAVAEQIQPSINASPEVSALVRERVALKQRGVKDGQGFYHWTPEAVAELRERMARVLLAVGELT